LAAIESWVWLAQVRRPQGRKGEVFAEILTDFPEKFTERRQVWLVQDASAPKLPRATNAAPRVVELLNHWLHKGGIVLHFNGINDISAAETLAGLMVAIPMEQRAPLGEDEVYVADLVGSVLFDVAPKEKSGADPARVGVIEDVDRTAGPVALLVVAGAQGEVLVPFAKSFIRKLDLEAKIVEMALPEGLVDLNAPGKA
jgi:16S rRNA processing protein RimM